MYDPIVGLDFIWEKKNVEPPTDTVQYDPGILLIKQCSFSCTASRVAKANDSPSDRLTCNYFNESKELSPSCSLCFGCLSEGCCLFLLPATLTSNMSLSWSQNTLPAITGTIFFDVRASSQRPPATNHCQILITFLDRIAIASPV